MDWKSQLSFFNRISLNYTAYGVQKDRIPQYSFYLDQNKLDELPTFLKHSTDIEKHLVKVQSYESDCDRIYIDAAHALYADKDADPQAVRLSHALLDTVEEAMDSVENAAERVQALIAQSV